MPNRNQLSPQSQFPKQAVAESVQVQPKPNAPAWEGDFSNVLTIGFASAADQITPWGKNVKLRDKQLREFWPTESYLAGALVNVCFRNTAFDWEIQGESDRVTQAVTDVCLAAIAGDSFGWVPFMEKVSQDIYCLYGRSTITLGGSRYGKKKTIQEMVDEKDEGPVLTILDGQIVERKVVQWEKTPLAGRSWVWISLKNTSGHSGKRMGGLWITEDHPVLTDNGWIEAGNVQVGMQVASSHPDLNRKQEELLVGTLLGDASLSVPGNNAQIKITHCNEQEEYLKLKMGAFAGMVWTPMNGTKHKQVNSQVSFSLNKWRESWYPKGKKIVPREIVESHFTPLMLAAWYMDDGSIHKQNTNIGTPTNPGVFMSTQGFTKDDTEWLSNLLNSKGISSSVQRIEVKGKEYFRIYIHISGAHILFSTIAKYVPPSMRYKVPDGYDDFSQEEWEIGNVKPSFDTVVIAEKKPLRTGKDGLVQTTYHLGVDETRNFIANNIVVHNSQDNGGFIELIRDPGIDSSSKFKGSLAPVIGIAHLDSNQCSRTGNAEYPVLYEDSSSKIHKLKWYQVIPLSDFPSSIQRMNGVGICGVSRALRLAQIMRSIFLYKDEKIGGRHFKSIHLVSGVSRTELEDARKRGREEADNQGQVRYIDPVILASLDPEKPVSTATIDLASLPDGFDLDQEMQWYIAGLALDFGVDYQEFAPMPGGNIGSSAQSVTLHQKTSGKGPRIFMRTLIEAFTNYGLVPRGYKMIYNDRNEQEEMEKQEIRTKAIEEIVMAVRAGVLTPEAARKDLVRRGIYTKETVAGIEESYGDEIVAPKQKLGDTGGSTVGNDTKRQDTGKTDENKSGRLTKMLRKLTR